MEEEEGDWKGRKEPGRIRAMKDVMESRRVCNSSLRI